MVIKSQAVGHSSFQRFILIVSTQKLSVPEGKVIQNNANTEFFIKQSDW